MTTIFIIYGLSFIVMGMVVLTLPRGKGLSLATDRLWLVGLFGFIHGAKELVDAAILNISYLTIPLSVLEMIGAFLLPASFICLVMFGGKVLSLGSPRVQWLKHVWVLSILVWAGVFVQTRDFKAADIAARYFICVPGTILTALVFYFFIRRIPSGSGGRYRIIVGLVKSLPWAFLAYGILGGLVTPKSGHFLTAIFSYDSFQQLTGLPVQIFRAGCAVVILVGAWALIELFKGDQRTGAHTRSGLARKVAVWVSTALLFVSGGSVICGSLYSINVVRNIAGNDSYNMASILARDIAGDIDRRFSTIKGYAGDLVWVEAIKAKNPMYQNMEPGTIQQYMSNMDQQWVSETKDSPLILEYLSSDVGRELADIVKQDANIVELFITDIQGGLVAASQKTSDFNQADEGWWQSAYDGGKGRDYLGPVELDQSSGMMSVAFAVPIKSEGRVIGICKAIVKTGIFFDALASFSSGKTGHAVMIDGNNDIIFHKDTEPLSSKFSDTRAQRLISDKHAHWMDNSQWDQHLEGPSFIGWEMIRHPLLSAGRQQWTIIVAHDRREVYQPLFQLITMGVGSLFILVLLTVPFGFFLGRWIADPVKRLQMAVKGVTQGDLKERVTVRTGDELEDLADAFNLMSATIQNTMVSRDELLKEAVEREKAQKEALASKLDWEDSFNAISDMITIHDKDFRILRANKAAQQVLGLPIGDILRQPCFMSFHGKECPPDGCPSCHALKTGVPGTLEVFESHLNKYVEIKAMPRFDADGRVIGVVHIVRDITDQKTAEDKLHQNLKEALKTREIMTSMLEDNNLIRERLEQHIKDLGKSQNMLIHSEKLASLGRLVSEIAHEVNNPLMIISGNAQLSLMSDKLEAEEKSNLEIIVKECQRAKNVIRRVLRFARPSKGEVAQVDISQSIEAVVGIVDKQFMLSQNVEIKRQYSKKVIDAWIDEQQMQEVFMNLLNNSKEAMPSGGVITITTLLEGKWIRVDFQDTGIGMSQDVLSKVMEPFFTTKETGNGIGLAICYGIVKAHGGDLRFESELGKGTTATILLPLETGGKLNA